MKSIDAVDREMDSELVKLDEARREFVSKQLSEKYGFKIEYATKLWDESRTNGLIEQEKCAEYDEDDYISMQIRDETIYLDPRLSNIEMEFEMTGSSHWMAT